ncbi:MAG: hypothetical protein WBZ29_08620 [Methanocella sp.]
MDISGTLYSVFGVSEPLFLAVAALVALLLAVSLSAAVLETVRIYREYTSKEQPEEPAAEPEKAVLLPGESEKVDITKLGHIAAQKPAEPVHPSQPAHKPAPPVTPAVDVVKSTLPESIKALTAKYGLDWLTIASNDGLVIASTSKTPDEDAAVYSNLFHELYRTRAETYFNVSNKDIHLLQVESGGHKVIDVASKAGPMTQDLVSGLREDTRKVVERFLWGGRKS